MTQTAPTLGTTRLAPSSVQALAEEAYSYFYPMVTMDVTRLQLTDPAQRSQLGRGAPITLVHVRTFPPAEFR
ncbi:MAG TPA: hypothetical protein VFU98_14490, partial [Microlunatus sp.]|nr:hypothetical protein [Microlunatus sp.]